MSENNIKALSTLVDDLDLMVKKDQYLQAVNIDPEKFKLVKDHPFAKGVKFIPISTVELLLDKMFQEWRVEIKETGQLLNSIFVTVRVHYKHPITKEWTYNDGVGAVAIQVDQGKNASELQWIKSNAIMLGLPSAKSFAIKDATDHIGKLFGRDINRKDEMAFTPSYATDENIAKVEEEKEAIRKKLDESN